MKKLTILLYVLLVSLTAFPQGTILPESAAFKKLLENQIPQPGIVYQLNNTECQILTSPRILDENGDLLMEEIYQEWDSTHWVYTAKSTSKYDINNNNRIEKLDQSWVDLNWENSGKFIYTYDANNNLYRRVLEIWTESSWLTYRRLTLTYDENSNLYKELVENWDGSIWSNLSKRTYSWDENNNLTFMLWENWEYSTWVNEVQESYFYDENNNKIEWLRKSWNGSEWVNSTNWFFFYDENFNMIEDLQLHWQNSVWNTGSKNFYTYDNNNNQVEMLTQYWNGSNWDNGQKYTLAYDSNNNRIQIVRKDWNGSNWGNKGRSTFYHIPAGSEQVEHKKTNINKPIDDFETTEDDLIVDSGKDDKTLIGIEVLIDSVTHTSDGNLEFTLSHDGISETIIYQAGGEGDNFIGTRLTDNGIDSIASGLAPFSGNYKAEEPLSSFVETDPEGTWTLSIYDGVAGNTGMLHAWGINLIYGPITGVDDDFAEALDYEIYPNPARGEFHVQSLLAGQAGSRFKVGGATLEILDLGGRKLVEKQIPSGIESFMVDVCGLKSGVYCCKISTSKCSQTKKLIITK